MTQARILIVDDEELVRWGLRERLTAAGHEVLEAASGREAVAQLKQPIDLVLLDLKLPDAEGTGLLRELKAIDPDLLVIVMTAFSSIESGIQAIKEGAFHYVSKPFNHEELLLSVEQGLETTRMRRELKSVRKSQSQAYSFDRIIGASPPMRSVKRLLERVAASPATTILLTGESGTGKDLAAKAIHYNSDRAHRPFMNITCSALPEALLESELFGHERGAFTDAKQLKKGLLEHADGGSVFLDEIGEMTPGLQAKLLRFLEEHAFKRVGGMVDLRIDVRVIAATNRDLGAAVAEGTFREDLFYRLAVMPVALPPLRERSDDIPLLVQHYVEAFNREFRKNVKGVQPRAIAALMSYSWPGNVRELKNSIERAMLLADREMLGVEDLQPLPLRPLVTNGFQLPPEGIDLARLERELVVQALERTHGNQTRAAGLLGMNRDQIRYRIEKFKLPRPHLEALPRVARG
ncbi:MAG: sigma-54-dependent Fis family transcriptional regulator [Deltaproteobacteria bacterium]|nr:sigma-54-dependent Fis family transcriptional regulator [Deltaproteobacteria bacterium]